MSLKCLLITVLFLTNSPLFSQDSSQPDTVTFQSDELQLKGLLWKPMGKGLFPAVLYNHGSELHPEKFLGIIAPAFVELAMHSLFLSGVAKDFQLGQGKYIGDDLDSVSKLGGPAARFKAMISLHETTQLQDQLGALAFLKTNPAIDSNRIAVAGISFGGIQTQW